MAFTSNTTITDSTKNYSAGVNTEGEVSTQDYDTQRLLTSLLEQQMKTNELLEILINLIA